MCNVTGQTLANIPDNNETNINTQLPENNIEDEKDKLRRLRLAYYESKK
jgi:hypothetical protein